MNPPPILGVLLILSVVGTVADYRYKKAGGKPSSKRDRLLFLLVLLLVASFFVLLAVIPNGDDLHDPFRLERIEGQIVIPIAIWLFAAWELGRWRMRRKYPLPKPEEPMTPERGGKGTMTDADRRAQLLELWSKLPENERTYETGPLNFFKWVQENRPDLLVEGAGDPYQRLRNDIFGNAN